MMRTILLFTLAFVSTAAVAAQTAPTTLTIDGAVERPLKLNATDLAKIPHVSVRAKGHDGKEAAYDGIQLDELLKLAGVQFGEKLRGKAISNYLLVEAADGYKAVFALPEIDPEFNERSIILADKVEGKPLGEKQGPWQIIVAGEKMHARWVRQVIALHVKQSSEK